MVASDEVRPIYTELQDWLIMMSDPAEGVYLEDPAVWEAYHTTLEQLEQITGKKFKKFMLTIQNRDGRDFVETDEYCQKLDLLIIDLHGRYFRKEPMPYFERNDEQVMRVTSPGWAIKLLKLLGFEPEMLNDPQVQKSIKKARKLIKKKSFPNEDNLEK